MEFSPRQINFPNVRDEDVEAELDVEGTKVATDRVPFVTNVLTSVLMS